MARQESSRQSGNQARPLPKRRLPLVPPKKEPLLPARPPSPTEAENPYVRQIVESIRRVCAISHMSPFTLIDDWTGMLEAALRLYADNARSYALTGHFIDDPPEVKEIYRRARERYLKATEKYPATYREMQGAFAHTFALLVAAAGEDLAPYAGQAEASPDIVGQVCLACLELGPAWWPYFPPWPAALKAARKTIPNAEELAYQVLFQAHLDYREARPADYIHPEPGELFERWLTEILPYCEPVIIGPTLVDSSALMLAAAAQFPDWAVKDGLVLFYPQTGQPLLDRLARINTYLYGLNGYELQLVRAMQDITAQMQEPETLHRPEPYLPPGAEIRPPTQPRAAPPSASRVRPIDGASFAELFRRIK